MANRSYLICTSSNYSYDSLNQDQVLCAASYMIPIFWYMLFEEKDLHLASVPCDAGEPNFEYSILSASKVKALSLAKSRLPKVIQLFGEKISEVFYVWLSHIEGISETTIVLETCELAMMSDLAAYKNEVEQHISAFYANPISTQGFFKTKDTLNLNWKSMLEQAEISNTATMPDVYKLCGYSWVKDVPWE